jgi:hypothetical protein
MVIVLIIPKAGVRQMVIFAVRAVVRACVVAVIYRAVGDVSYAGLNCPTPPWGSTDWLV